MKNENYVIFTDASADVALDVSAKGDIHFISMPCAFEDGRVYECTGTDSDEKVRGFYRDIRTGGLPGTTQITPYQYREYFMPYLKDGKSVIYLSLSSGLSSTFESAKMFDEQLKSDDFCLYRELMSSGARVYPIDSIGATGAMGILIDRLLENQQMGMTVEDNVRDIEEFKHCIYTTCYVEDLHHLKRGGRIGAVKAAIGSMLNLKPIIIITPDGKIASTTNCRGARKAVSYLCDKYKELADMTSTQAIVISDADNKEMADFMQEEVLKINPKVKIHRCKLSPIIGTHLGPESVLIAFVTKKPRK